MAGVFLSYSRTDREVAERVLRGLRAVGLKVWWDQDMPGVNWQDELERQITELSTLVVIWTPSSCNSAYVKDEARLALSHDKLVNVLCGILQPPFPFDRVNGLPIDDWDGVRPHARWRLVVETIEAHLVVQGAVEPGDLTAALDEREASVRAALEAADRAQVAFADAKAAEGLALEQSGDAADTLKAAEDEFQRIVDMRAKAAVVRTAQSELDNAREAASRAQEARREAANQLAAASREFKRAQAELEALYGNAASQPFKIAPSMSAASGRASEASVATPSATPGDAERSGPTSPPPDAAPAEAARLPPFRPPQGPATASVGAALRAAGVRSGAAGAATKPFADAMPALATGLVGLAIFWAIAFLVIPVVAKVYPTTVTWLEGVAAHLSSYVTGSTVAATRHGGNGPAIHEVGTIDTALVDNAMITGKPTVGWRGAGWYVTIVSVPLSGPFSSKEACAGLLSNDPGPGSQSNVSSCRYFQSDPVASN